MARFYVSTYKKYNKGTLKGAWMDTDDFTDAADFFEACAELHKDEDDPELMFQDCEDCPDHFYSESMSEHKLQELYDYLNDYDEDDRAIIEEYWEDEDSSESPSRIMEMYCYTGTGIEYAEILCDECGDLENVPNFIKYHIDWEGVWHDLECDGYTETRNYVFDGNR